MSGGGLNQQHRGTSDQFEQQLISYAATNLVTSSYTVFVKGMFSSSFLSCLRGSMTVSREVMRLFLKIQRNTAFTPPIHKSGGSTPESTHLRILCQTFKGCLEKIFTNLGGLAAWVLPKRDDDRGSCFSCVTVATKTIIYR